jgi:hypothetical protein
MAALLAAQPASTRVVYRCCRALVYCFQSQAAPFRAAAMAAGIPRALVPALFCQISVLVILEVLDASCEVLASLARGSPAYRAEVVAAGGVKAALAVLFDQPQLCFSSACSLLVELVRAGHGALREMKARNYADALAGVLEAKEDYEGGHADATAAVWSVLRNMAFAASFDGSDSSSFVLGSTPSPRLQTAFTALRTEISHAPAARAGCSALLYMATTDNALRTIQRLGGIELLEAAVRAQPRDLTVGQAAGSLLPRLRACKPADAPA